MEDLMEETTAIKTSNMVYPVPCLKDIEYLKIQPTPKNQIKADKREAINNIKTSFRLSYVYMFLCYIL